MCFPRADVLNPALTVFVEDEPTRGVRLAGAFLVAVAALTLSGPASAADPIEVYFEGTVQSGSGLAGSLDGMPITGRFVFDPDLAPEDSFTEEDDPTLLSLYRGDYIGTAVGYQWISSDFQVGGQTYVSLPDVPSAGTEFVQVVDFISPACVCYDQYTVSDVDVSNTDRIAHALGFSMVRFMSGPGNFLNGQQIDQYFTVEGFGEEDQQLATFAHIEVQANNTLSAFASGSFRLSRIVAARLGEGSLTRLTGLFAFEAGLAALSGQARAQFEAGNATAACAMLNAAQLQLSKGSGARFSNVLDLAALKQSVASAMRDIGCSA